MMDELKGDKPADDNADDVEASRAPLLDHLIELRGHLMVVLGALVIGFAICFVFAQQIYDVLLVPFQEAAAEARQETGEPLELIFTAPLEFFFVKVKLAFFGAIGLALPVVMHQVYAFVAPGLYRNERGAVAPFLIATPVLFAAGAALVYYFILPFVLGFALGQEQTGEGRVDIQLLPRVSDYLNLVTTLILAFGISFQLPVLLSLMARAGLVTAKGLLGFWKYAVVVIFAFAMFVTPPDPISQIMLGVALLGLYFISVGCVALIERGEAKAQTALEKTD